MRPPSFAHEVEYLATILCRCRKLRSLKLRWGPCQQRRSCIQAPPLTTITSMASAATFCRYARRNLQEEALQSLGVNIFQSHHTINELGMTANFLTAVSKVKDLTLRGQFAFWEPVLAFSRLAVNQVKWLRSLAPQPEIFRQASNGRGDFHSARESFDSSIQGTRVRDANRLTDWDSKLVGWHRAIKA